MKFGVRKQNWYALCMIAVVLFSSCMIAGAEEGQTGLQDSEQMLLEIIDMHTRLVNNETFLAQAGAVGAYLEAAKEANESMKCQIYGRVQKLLSRIQLAGAREYLEAKEQGSERSRTSSRTRSSEGSSSYERGKALLEIYRASSMNQLPDLPAIRAYWTEALAFKRGRPGLGGVGFLVPEHEDEVRNNSTEPYVAKFTFWYEVVEPGKFGFTILPGRSGEYILRIGGVDVVKSSRGIKQGICMLEKGFHRAEFWYIGKYAAFEVKVLPPGAFNAVPFSRDMLLLKKQ